MQVCDQPALVEPCAQGATRRTRESGDAKKEFWSITRDVTRDVTCRHDVPLMMPLERTSTIKWP
jgi:hypothetical protein